MSTELFYPGKKFAVPACFGLEGKREEAEKTSAKQKKGLKNLCRLVYNKRTLENCGNDSGNRSGGGLVKEKDKYKGSLILKIAVLCCAAFFLVSLVGQQIRIKEKQEELEVLQAQLKTQQIKNEELKNSLEKGGDLADYAEKVARRDLDYAKPGERVFIDIGGSD